MDQNEEFRLTPPPDGNNSVKPARTPMMQQYMEAKNKEPDAILFFRMGDFYEMFFDDAVVASKILEIALTTRDRKSDNPVPMCGIPFHALDNYIGKLIKAGHRIAICDQIEDPKLAKGLVKRDITRIITPGTIHEENLLEARENNYLCAIAEKQKNVSAAFVDVSTGEFVVTGHQGNTKWNRIIEDLSLYHPREIIFPSALQFPDDVTHRVQSVMCHSQDDWWFGTDYARQVIKQQFSVSTLNSFGFIMDSMIAAAGGALQYLHEVQKADISHISKIEIQKTTSSMIIDDVSRRNLELTESWMTGDKKDSLLGLLDQTKTNMGGRLFRQWLLRPLLKVDGIHARLDAVEELSNNTVLYNDLNSNFRHISDIERLITRVTMQTANARDLVSLRRSLEPLPEILGILTSVSSEFMQQVSQEIDPLEDIVKSIETVLVENPPLQMKEGGLIAEGADAELDELKSIVRDNKSIIADIERRERGATGISNLRIRYNRVFGYYIEISKGNLDLVPEQYIRKQTLVNAERFITPELKEFESKVLNAQEKIQSIEYRLFCELRGVIALESERILRTSGAISKLDVLCSLAKTAVENNYCKPVLNESNEIRIVGGRHPVVEKLRIEEAFIPNDTLLDTNEHRLLIITGPNMGGKSTYLRQVALLTIMAQMGSFVPAQQADIGIVDRIFTRIGASDYLARGHSTFMVEMSETAHILRNATQRSLIILDEIGRGTSTFDGLSIAWAVAEYIHDNPGMGTKTLFATHYHELTDLALTLSGVKNYNVDAQEHEDDVIFLRTVVPGPSDQSYGIQVAKLAGMPSEVVKRAKEILKNLELNEFDKNGKPRLVSSLKNKKTKKKSQLHPLLSELKSFDLETLTPLDSLQLLHQLQKKLKNED